MRRFSVAEALLIVGSCVFVVVAFLALELQRTHQQRMERLLAAQARGQASPVEVKTSQEPPAAESAPLAMPPEPPAIRRHPGRPKLPKPVHTLDLDACEGSRDPLCGMH
jgi:hypothetical protein